MTLETTPAAPQVRMKKVVPISNNQRDLSQKIRKLFSGDFPDLNPVFFYTKKSCIDYLIYETPDLVIVNFADKKSNKYELLADINEDRWLNCAGIIALHDMREDEFLKKVSGSNIVALLHLRELETKLPRILRIIEKNRNILFQREFQGMFIGEISGSLEVDNDLLDIQVHANLIANFVYNTNYIDESGKQSLKLILHELLINAVEHGNCGITFDEKTKITQSGMTIAEAVAQKVQNNPEIAKKRVRLSYQITPDKTSITIRDEGAGFDWRKRMKKSVDLNANAAGEILLHGRGIAMSLNFCDNIQYNEKGNQVSFDFRHHAGDKVNVPGFFEEGSLTHFARGQVVFRRGEESNFLYYIASGKYNILDEHNGLISTLSSSDAFIGEMSFLLNNKRTASVVTAEEGILYKISKNNFIAAMQKTPYYSFFLCKLLARRLESTNRMISVKRAADPLQRLQL